MLPFFNLIAQDSKKKKKYIYIYIYIYKPDNVEKAHKSPESPKVIKKLESFAHQVPGNIQNITPNMPTINTPLLYQKDNLDGHSSNVCNDDRLFYEEINHFDSYFDNLKNSV